MEFPKRYMTIKEMAGLGLSAKAIRKLAIEYGYPLAIRESTCRTSPIKIDTKEYERVIKQTSRIMERR